jgi:hypothetical protein
MAMVWPQQAVENKRVSGSEMSNVRNVADIIVCYLLVELGCFLER